MKDAGFGADLKDEVPQNRISQLRGKIEFALRQKVNAPMPLETEELLSRITCVPHSEEETNIIITESDEEVSNNEEPEQQKSSIMCNIKTQVAHLCECMYKFIIYTNA